LKEKLQAEAKDRGMSMSALIVEKLVTAGEVTRVSVKEMFDDPEVTPMVRVQPKEPLDVVENPLKGTPGDPQIFHAEAQLGCTHPKARQVNVIGGKKCMQCGRVKKLNGGWV
jgi:hypothetical protein